MTDLAERHKWIVETVSERVAERMTLVRNALYSKQGYLVGTEPLSKEDQAIFLARQRRQLPQMMATDPEQAGEMLGDIDRLLEE